MKKYSTLHVAFSIALLLTVAGQVSAQTANTTLQVINVQTNVSAEVVCGPVNCPELPVEEPAQVQSVQPERNWWTRVVEWIQTFIT